MSEPMPWEQEQYPGQLLSFMEKKKTFDLVHTSLVFEYTLLHTFPYSNSLIFVTIFYLGSIHNINSTNRCLES